MKAPDLIAKRIVELLRPDSYDSHEEKLIRERDEVWRGEVTLIECLHHNTITHTNGSIQCINPFCLKMLKEVRPKWEKEE